MASTGKGSDIEVGVLAVGEVTANHVFCSANTKGFIFVYKQTGDTVGCVDAQDSSSDEESTRGLIIEDEWLTEDRSSDSITCN